MLTLSKQVLQNVLLWLVILLASSQLQAQETTIEEPAPGYGSLGFPLAQPGSYELPVLHRAANGQVLSENGEALELSKLYAGRYSLISFMYSNCSDLNGCPLSAFVFYKLKSAMQKDPKLAARLQLISLSFDPARDTPDVMKLYGNNFRYAGDSGDWLFLTTESESELLPILKDYKQDLQRYYSVEDNTREEYAHILRVFLVDPDQNIRNIYSVEFLHADIVLNDLNTLLMEQSDIGSSLHMTGSSWGVVSEPGDYRQGYEDKSFQSRSRSVESRGGKQNNLVLNASRPPLGLPPVPDHLQDHLTEEKIRLGQKLFFDRRLSLNDTFSCAMCHIPEQGFSSNELATAVGIEGRTVRRNSPTIYNVAYYDKFFHDGRESSLARQVWGPLLARNEMANPSPGFVIDKLNTLSDYKNLFENAFNGESANMETVGEALAAYQTSLISANAPFDQWYFGQQENAVSDNVKSGFKLFTGKAGCNSCHLIAGDSALFTDNQLHNTGTGYKESMGIPPAKRRITIAPGVFVEVEQSIIDSVSEKPPSDLGLYEITQNPADRWKYKTPSLRNIALTAPYMHNGSLSNLRDVIEFYNHGGIDNEVLDPLIRPLSLTETEIDHIEAFLLALTGSNVDALVEDAFAAPVGDPH